ncbi:MAG TPA: hypothetical protein VHM70_28315 [Polyangiaceae bacterium]|jgi:hypothetical protein|nr:hypothetical protein [Polyangiaceae bacterium]
MRRSDLDASSRERLWQVYELLTRESLDYVASVASKRFSGICNDGTPWQFCSVLDSSGTETVRFLTEVGAQGVPLSERTALTVSRVEQILKLLDRTDHDGAIDVIAKLTPRDDEQSAGLWVGCAANAAYGVRLRVYANNGWGSTTDRWLRLVEGFRGLAAGGFAAEVNALVQLLVPTFSPNGLAWTVPASTPRCKLYLRPIGEPWGPVRELAAAILGRRAGGFLASIEHAFGKALEAMPSKSLVASIAGPARGGPVDLKLDLCGHCLLQNDAAASSVVIKLCEALSLAPAPYQELLRDVRGCTRESDSSTVAFIGVGLSAEGSPRVNVYFTPNDSIPAFSEVA